MAPREKPVSTTGIQVPKRRHLHSVDVWLEDKQSVDGAEGLWRIHDKLYDLSDFIDKHPGGSEWLELSKGLDITNAFESHHISLGPEQLLPKYYVRDAKTPRNCPFTFKENGFYKTLKKEVREHLAKISTKQSTKTTNFFADALLVGHLFFSCLAAHFWNFWLATLAGNFLAMLAIAAHNYVHRKDSFRMYYMHFSLTQVREWRVSHIFSHHLHTNTVDDLEISQWEPFIQYLPEKKSNLVRYGSYLYVPLLWITGFHMALRRRLQELFKGNMRHAQPLEWLGFSVPIIMWFFSGQSLWWCFVMWNYIVLAGSTHFFLVGLQAAHHHPDIFHDGDTLRSKHDYDWGIGQLDAVMDRREINGSHFLVLTNFGDHALHHLFPTLDHGTLEHLYPVFEKVCDEFDVNVRMASQLDTFIGGFQQLARVKPNSQPPNLKKYKQK